jgi:hypothetical protein
MRRNSRQLLIAGLAAGTLIGGGLLALPAAEAATPPIDGTVSCTLTGSSTFSPALGYRQGIGGKRVSPNANAKWRLDGTLTGCSGTQTGGSPRTPGPIARGEIVVRGKATGHECSGLTANGMTVRSVRIKWFDALGNRMPSTKATGVATVAGLYNGFPPFISFDPIIFDPSYVPPGVITFNLSGTVKSTARAFPGRPITMTAAADETLESMVTPCNTRQTPSLTFGISGFGFTGTTGSSTISIG